MGIESRGACETCSLYQPKWGAVDSMSTIDVGL